MESRELQRQLGALLRPQALRQIALILIREPRYISTKSRLPSGEDSIQEDENLHCPLCSKNELPMEVM